MERRKKLWVQLDKNLRALKEPRNVLLVGSLGVGKSSFINSAITALTGKYDYYADIGDGSKHQTKFFHRISRDDYWDPDDEADKCKHLELPTFIDIIGLDAQLSASKGDEETVNSILLHLIINGRLPENCDLLDASKKLKAGQKLKKRNEEKNLKVDTVIVVISTENPIIPQSLIDEIYREAKIRERNIPVFAVLTKVDISGMSEQELEDKKTEICGVIGITKDKLLVCRNYQPGDTPDIETDIKILEFMITVCNPRIQAFTYTKVEVEEDVKMKFWKEAIAVAFVAIIIALLYLIQKRLF
ncbi:uncharacterized protein LOC134268646 [Saccostrea cucullata]|uniref:uncharacterized protein LOC134268646 n=1 Tax=Saccostrea cuccullata TaxID=36930 RepID=UPI002ED02A58